MIRSFIYMRSFAWPPRTQAWPPGLELESQGPRPQGPWHRSLWSSGPSGWVLGVGARGSRARLLGTWAWVLELVLNLGGPELGC